MRRTEAKTPQIEAVAGNLRAALWAAAAGVLFAAALAPRPALPAVFGADNRVQLPATHRHLEQSIGMLYESGARTVCTAFCVDEDIVATASHCLFRTAGETAPKLNGFTFRTADKGAKAGVRIAGAESSSAAQNILSGSHQLSIRPPIEATRDWALVRLAQPVCKGRSLPVSRKSLHEVKALAEAGRVYQVGYHHDLPTWQLALGAPCFMRRGESQAERKTISRDFADTRDLVLHSCDTGGASSGSPLLVDTLKGPEVVAINVGTYVRSRVLVENGAVVQRYRSDTIANTAVGAGAFADTLALFAGAEVLARREQVKRLQSLLAERGYYRGAQDGAYGPALRTAIESFERAEHRRPTGLASASLLERLIASRETGTAVTIEDSRIETGSVTAPRNKRPKTR